MHKPKHAFQKNTRCSLFLKQNSPELDKSRTFETGGKSIHIFCMKRDSLVDAREGFPKGGFAFGICTGDDAVVIATKSSMHS